MRVVMGWMGIEVFRKQRHDFARSPYFNFYYYLISFYDLTKTDKNFKVLTQGEKRERQLLGLIKKTKKTRGTIY